MIHIKLFESFENFYDNMTPEEAIDKATADVNLAMKNGNESQADKVLGNLKTHLTRLKYNWRQDPRALELLSDFI